MMAAQDEKANGPATPSNEHERIVSQWIAPVRISHRLPPTKSS